ncbi:hypothetical protein EXIGLDRAFT_747135 [Exidia glandulosa HHB12029]|uniref:Transmembrane protein n=1 Tax=Exidia glandulosa HHB12029 TaxID=1314781 RepID=A0A165L544_EXIGL|nr:hypothetical protein EXIGLDRAFT_747135 [Exidia glandulosa HHB12029]
MSVAQPLPSPITPLDVRVEDNHASVQYSEGWTTSTDPSLYTGSSYHLTYHQNASAVFSFTGSYIWFISDLNNDHGQYGVSIDSGVWRLFSSNSAVLEKQQILFAAEVEPGPHSITIMDWENRGLGVDQFAYRPLDFALSSSSSTTSSFASSSSPSTSGLSSSFSETPLPVQSVTLPAGAYVGVGLGAAALLILLVLGSIILWTRRRRRPVQPQPVPTSHRDTILTDGTGSHNWASFAVNHSPVVPVFGGQSSHSPS